MAAVHLSHSPPQGTGKVGVYGHGDLVAEPSRRVLLPVALVVLDLLNHCPAVLPRSRPIRFGEMPFRSMARAKGLPEPGKRDTDLGRHVVATIGDTAQRRKGSVYVFKHLRRASEQRNIPRANVDRPQATATHVGPLFRQLKCPVSTP